MHNYKEAFVDVHDGTEGVSFKDSPSFMQIYFGTSTGHFKFVQIDKR